MAISSARQFFEKAITEGVPFLESLAEEHVHETEWLDFKGGDDLGDGQIKSLWTKAICGFANNQGGVLVWGVDARRDPETDIDAANAVKHVEDPAWLRSRLTQLHPGATEPPLLGVESVAIHADDSGGPGFVVSYIPESDSKPHRCEMLENKPYFIRVGDSFKIPSPSILRNLFFPHSAPQLHLSVTCEWESIRQDFAPPDIEIFYRLYIKNTSAVSAREIFVIAKTLPLGLPIECPYKTTTTDTDFGTGIEFNRVLHPFSRASLGVVRHRVGVAQAISASGTTFQPSVGGRAFAAYFQIFANDMLPTRQQVAFGDYDVHHRHFKEAMIVPEFDPEFYGDSLRQQQ